MDKDDAEVFRAELKEGFSLEFVAKKYGVTVATVKRHAAYDLGGRKLLLGTEVHIEGERGRWEFTGGIGYSADEQQYAGFRNSRTGRTRIFHTRRVTTIHNRRKRAAA